jgi:DNA topoisomerase I
LSLVFSSSSPSSPLKIEKKRAKVPSASQEKGKLWATDLGMMVCDILYRNFTNIFEYGFTAKVESNLDLVA